MGPARAELLALAIAAGAGAACGPPGANGRAPPAPRPPAPPGASDGGAGPERLYGVTVDDVSDLDAIVDALGALARRPTARVVFDEDRRPAHYRNAVARIHRVAHVMGELVDSLYVPRFTTAQYRARAKAYVDALGADVDVWEIGNEINGEWLGRPRDVVAKITAAYEVVEERGGRTALTLYYNEGCWERAAHEMFRWTEAHVPAALRAGLDYVFVSYYEDDCEGLQPDWPVVFARLAELFPAARLGIGECGTTDPSRKPATIARYYGLEVPQPRFVGGFFWWYFRQDMVPRTRPLWRVLDDAISGGP